MEFKNDTQKAHFEKMGQYMKDLFGEMANARDDIPAHYLIMGSATVQVFILRVVLELHV